MVCYFELLVMSCDIPASFEVTAILNTRMRGYNLCRIR